MKVIRSLYWVIFTLFTLFLAALYIPWFWFLEKRGRQQQREEIAWRFGHWWGRVVLGATGSKVTVFGGENIPEGPVVVMGNHQSYFDIMLMLGYINKPLAFIAKKELARWPLISQWIRYLGCLFLNRKDVRQAALIINEAVQKVQNGSSMVIFPEGTRSRSAEMAAFKNGSMKLAVRANVPIVPVSIEGTYKAFEGNGYRIGPARITLTISPAILPGDYANLGTGQVAELVRTKIEQGLNANLQAGSK